MSVQMTSREIIKRCVHFDSPPRLGLRFERFGIDDTVNVCEFFVKDQSGADPWGTVWTVHPDIPTIGIATEHPVKTQADLARVRTPDPREFAARTMDRLRNLSADEKDRYRYIATSSGIWERPQNMRGMEQLMDDLVFAPEMARALIKICTDFWVDFIGQLAPARGEVDALYMFDDWGTQTDTMISPAMWREFFAPSYRRIADAVHANGMDYWLHSCGRVTNLIGEFAAAGIDLVNPYQSGTCGYEEVAQRFAGKIAFLTTVDTQSTLPHGTRQQILEECRRLETWATPKGGLIVSSYSYDIDEDKERAVIEYFQNKHAAR